MRDEPREALDPRKGVWKPAALALLAVMLLLTSGCYGKFAATRTVYHLNEGIPGDSLETVTMWVLSPVYVGAIAVDAFGLNVIQFWLGAESPSAWSQPADGPMIAVAPPPAEPRTAAAVTSRDCALQEAD